MIFPDGGEGYRETVYDDEWVRRELGVAPAELELLVGPERGRTPTG